MSGSVHCSKWYISGRCGLQHGAEPVREGRGEESGNIAKAIMKNNS